MSVFGNVFGSVFGAVFDPAGQGYPIPYDVRAGVQYGTGMVGTLMLPLPQDVRAGTLYGGDGNQYVGTLLAPGASSGGNEFIDAFNDLLDMQEDTLGERLTAAIAGVTVDIILENPDTAQSLMAESYTEDGATWIQCLASPFANRPIVFQSPVIMGGATLQVINKPESNHGIYRLQIGAPNRR